MDEQNFFHKVASGKKLDISKVKYSRGDICIVMQTIPIDKADEDGKITIEITQTNQIHCQPKSEFHLHCLFSSLDFWRPVCLKC